MYAYIHIHIHTFICNIIMQFGTRATTTVFRWRSMDGDPWIVKDTQEAQLKIARDS